MTEINKHIIAESTLIKDALFRLNLLSIDSILFIVDKSNKLTGSLTDGDVRRGLLNGFKIEDRVTEIMNGNPKSIQLNKRNIDELIKLRESNYKIIPILNEKNEIINVLNFRNKISYLPVDTVIMAGGKGSRLMPLTKNTPKPLIKVGDKPIIEHNIDRLSFFGIENYWISLNYLADQVVEYLSTGEEKNIKIRYVFEDTPLGTIGAVSKINKFKHDNILVTNSDLLTNLDYEKFFLDFINEDADFAVVSIPYNVEIPYAVIETNGRKIVDFKEKPTYTYYSNAGIYLMKKSVLKHIPKDSFFNSTDLMSCLIKQNKKVITHSFSGYWLDIGKHKDLEKAQLDIQKKEFNL